MNNQTTHRELTLSDSQDHTAGWAQSSPLPGRLATAELNEQVTQTPVVPDPAPSAFLPQPI